LLVAGVLLFVLGDLVYGYVTLNSSYQSGDPIDTTWIVALALMAIAGTTQRASDDAESIATTREGVSWLPPAAVAFGFGILLFSLRGEAVFPGLVMVVIAIMLAGLVLARQVPAVVARDFAGLDCLQRRRGDTASLLYQATPRDSRSESSDVRSERFLYAVAAGSVGN